jgi:hypothetical protein
MLNLINTRITLVAMTLVLSACGEFQSAGLSSSQRDLALEEMLQRGQRLYSQHCAACHGPIDTSSKLGRSGGQIFSALQSVPQMQSLSSTIDASMAGDIAEALNYYANGAGFTQDNNGRLIFNCSEGTISPSDLNKLSRREFINSIGIVLDIFSPQLKNDSSLQSLFNQLPTDIMNATSRLSHENPRATTQLSTLAEFNVAFRVGELISAQTSRLQTLPGTQGCLSASSITPDCHHNFVRYFAAYSLQSTFSESELRELSQAFYNGSLNTRDQITTTVAGLIMGPHFLYKSWLNGQGNTSDSRLIRLSSLEWANRLSFLITGAIADPTLRQLAFNGQLSQAEVIEQQVDRLMQSPLGRVNLARLFRETYGYDNFDNFSYPTGFLNGVSLTGLRNAMVSELDDFFTHIVVNQKGSFSDLFTSRYIGVNHTGLNQIYGHSAGPSQPLPASRSGFLNRAALLSQRSGLQTSPIQRGLSVLETVLCVDIGQAPASAPSSLPLTNRQQSTRERTQLTSQQEGTSCNSCHSRINPLGYPFESFDTLGRQRQQEAIYNSSGQVTANVSIDTSAHSNEIHGEHTQFANSVQLSQELAQSDRAQACLARNLKRFEAKRHVRISDSCHMNEALSGLRGSNSTDGQGSVRQMILNYVQSQRFSHWSF